MGDWILVRRWFDWIHIEGSDLGRTILLVRYGVASAIAEAVTRSEAFIFDLRWEDDVGYHQLFPSGALVPLGAPSWLFSRRRERLQLECLEGYCRPVFIQEFELWL